MVCRSTDGRVWRVIGGIKGDNPRGDFVVLLDAIVIAVKPEDGYNLRLRAAEGGCRCLSVRMALAPRSLLTAAYPNYSLIILGCVVRMGSGAMNQLFLLSMPLEALQQVFF